MNENTIIILILIPIISAIIGWITNFIAIKSLFRPYKKISFLGFTMYGVIPKRKKVISRKVAEVVSDYLISHKDLMEKFDAPENIEKIKAKIIPIISEKILMNIPAMFKSVAEPIIRTTLEKEADEIIFRVGYELVEYLEDNFDVKELVEKRLLAYDTTNLEKIILKIAKEEFKHIELLGAVIGFIVGLFQIALFLVLN